MLSSLCELSKSITAENENGLNQHELVTVYALPKSKIQVEVNATVNSFRNSLSTQIMSFINYFRIVTQANNFITALNTNTLTLYNRFYQPTQLIIFLTRYSSLLLNTISCGAIHSTSPTSFAPLLSSENIVDRYTWQTPPLNSTLVKGFYTGCSPFEALLRSTLDCLYDIECLQLFHKYYPSINQVRFIRTIILHKFMKFRFLSDKC